MAASLYHSRNPSRFWEWKWIKGYGLTDTLNTLPKTRPGQARPGYVELSRLVKKNTRIAKKNYEIKVANEAKSNPKGFFQMYRTKTREKI